MGGGDDPSRHPKSLLMTEIEKIILDMLKEIRDELRDTRNVIDSNELRTSDRISQLQVDFGKQKVKTSLLGVISGALAGFGSKFF